MRILTAHNVFILDSDEIFGVETHIDLEPEDPELERVWINANFKNGTRMTLSKVFDTEDEALLEFSRFILAINTDQRMFSFEKP